MLDEATKHIREAIMLGRTDILKKLLEEVKGSMTKAGKTTFWLLSLWFLIKQHLSPNHRS